MPDTARVTASRSFRRTPTRATARRRDNVRITWFDGHNQTFTAVCLDGQDRRIVTIWQPNGSHQFGKSPTIVEVATSAVAEEGAPLNKQSIRWSGAAVGCCGGSILPTAQLHLPHH